MDDPTDHSRINPLAALADEHCLTGVGVHQPLPTRRKPGIDSA